MRSKKTIVIIAITLIAVIAIVGYGTASRAPKLETVKTVTAVQGEINSYLSTNAVIQSQKLKNYVGASQLSVEKINVAVGQQVKVGQVMLEYDVNDLKTSVDQAKLQYSNAVLQQKELKDQKKKLDDAIKDLDSQIENLDPNNPADAVKLQTLKQQRQGLQPISAEKIKLMNNSVALAKIGLDSAESRYNKYKAGLVSEFTGTITALNASEGVALSPAQPAIVVQQLDNLKAKLSLGKYDARKIKVGQQAILKNGDSTYKGTVSFISPAAQKVTSMSGQDTSLEAEIDVTNPDENLKVDFDVNVDILLGTVEDALKLPVECIKFDKDGTSSIFLVVDGKAKETSIKLGLQSDVEVEVVQGLKAGDIVILNPGIAIKDGTAVKVNEGESK